MRYVYMVGDWFRRALAQRHQPAGGLVFLPGLVITFPAAWMIMGNPFALGMDLYGTAVELTIAKIKDLSSAVLEVPKSSQQAELSLAFATEVAAELKAASLILTAALLAAGIARVVVAAIRPGNRAAFACVVRRSDGTYARGHVLEWDLDHRGWRALVRLKHPAWPLTWCRIEDVTPRYPTVLQGAGILALGSVRLAARWYIRAVAISFAIRLFTRAGLFLALAGRIREFESGQKLSTDTTSEQVSSLITDSIWSMFSLVPTVLAVLGAYAFARHRRNVAAIPQHVRIDEPHHVFPRLDVDGQGTLVRWMVSAVYSYYRARWLVRQRLIDGPGVPLTVKSIWPHHSGWGASVAGPWSRWVLFTRDVDLTDVRPIAEGPITVYPQNTVAPSTP